MDDKKSSWKKFRALRFDSKKLSNRAHHAETATAKHAHKFVIGRLTKLRDVRSEIALWLVAVTVLIAAVSLQTIWYQAGYRTAAAASGGTYAEAMMGPVETLNPLYAQSDAENAAAQLLFSRLFDYDQTGHLRDELATSLRRDNSGRVYTVTLRDDVKWHDGTQLTADDVVFTVNLMKNPEARALMQMTWEGIGVKAIDQRTVEFRLPAVNSPFPHALTFAVLPEHILGSVQPGALRENTFSVSPTGSGPFQLRLLQKIGSGDGEHKIIHLTSWDEYFRGAPKLSVFEVHAYRSSQAIVSALQTREVNAALDVSNMKEQLPKGLVVDNHPINSGVYALINTESDTLKDVRVRRALQLGTDTRAIIQTLGVQANQLDLPFLPHQVAGASSLKKPAFNQAAARAQLEQAGWRLATNQTVRAKNGQPLVIRLAAIKDPQYHSVVDALAKQWRTLGADVQVEEFNPGAASQSFTQTVLQPRDYDVLVNELSIGGDPDTFAYWYSGEVNAFGRNYANYENEIVDDALLSARQRSEPALRDKKYQAFAAQWLKDAPAIGLYQSTMGYVHSEQTEAFSRTAILPTKTDRYGDVIYWTAARQDVYKTP